MKREHWVVLISLVFVIALTVTARAAEKYTPAPLQWRLLEGRVDANKKAITEQTEQICDLDTRVKDLEEKLASKSTVDPAVKPEPKEIVVKVVVEQAKPTTAIVEPVARPVTKTQRVVVSAPVITTQRVVSSPVKTSTSRRLKSTSELRSEVLSKWTKIVYATVEPNTESWIKRHLSDHGFSQSQVAGLTKNEAWMLHNLAHDNRISPYTAGAVVSAPVVGSPSIITPIDPTPRTPTFTPPSSPPPTNYNGGCPNGRCPTSRSTTRWYPGKLLGL